MMAVLRVLPASTPPLQQKAELTPSQSLLHPPICRAPDRR